MGLYCKWKKKRDLKKKLFSPNKMLAMIWWCSIYWVMNLYQKSNKTLDKIQIPGSVMAVVAFLFGCRGGFWEGGCFAKMLVTVTWSSNGRFGTRWSRSLYMGWKGPHFRCKEPTNLEWHSNEPTRDMMGHVSPCNFQPKTKQEKLSGISPTSNWISEHFESFTTVACHFCWCMKTLPVTAHLRSHSKPLFDSDSFLLQDA